MSYESVYGIAFQHIEGFGVSSLGNLFIPHCYCYSDFHSIYETYKIFLFPCKEINMYGDISILQFPKFEFYDPKTPFYTSPRFLPPTKIDNCRVC